ncbi:MAG: 50S ribosomal protein L4 [Planctomycetaceae bacterium]|jgi:large subunit ribosomal protein L4|nr:50S ribosomal protein L4 [Planctomycetaceae bacterium]
MATLPVYDKDGKEIETIEYDPSVIASKITKQLLHDAVVMYRANLRHGSAKTKNRGEVAGSKKKMYRQKGTGNARAGHRRSGVRRGGGHIFAKVPHDWHYRLPRKALKTATRMAVATKLQESNITIIDRISLDKPKTKDVATILKNLNLQGTLLITVEDYNVYVYKSGRNIEGVRVLPVNEINAYEVLRPKRVLMTKNAFKYFLSPVDSKTE